MPTMFEIQTSALPEQIESDVRYSLRRLDAFNDMGIHLGAAPWKHTKLEDLVQAITIHPRADLPNLFGDIIIKEAIAFTERNWKWTLWSVRPRAGSHRSQLLVAAAPGLFH